MSPEAPVKAPKPAAPSNIYTVIVAVALGAVLATAVFVALKCYFDYNTLWPPQ